MRFWGQQPTSATAARGGMPCVVPQLKSITLGGALAGVGIEATSFRHGLVHETVVAFDVLTGDGRIVHCTPDNEHRELFHGFANSYGTLGYALAVTARTQPVRRFVAVEHRRHAPPEACFADLARLCDAGDVDFLDGVAFAPDDLVVSVGRFADGATAPSDYGFERIFFAMIETIEIALAAALITFVVSMVLGSFAARNVAPNRAVSGGARLLLVGIRGIPELILAIVLIVITGLGAQAGTIALAVGGVGLLGKLIADSLEEVPRGPERALIAVGSSRTQMFFGATLPQGAQALVGHTFYLIDTNIRAATLLGIVGGGGVGYYLLNAGQGSNYQLVGSIVLMILVTVLLVEGLAMWMRKALR